MTFRPRSFRSDLNLAIEKAFRENGIEIPFPQRDVRVRANVAVQGSELGVQGLKEGGE